jgi:hypothetical protein
MNMPGFTAEASLHWAGFPYRSSDTPMESRGGKTVTPQLWRSVGKCDDAGCVACDEWGNCMYITHTYF